MIKINVLFLKDGGKYGYSVLAGETAGVFDADLDYLVANGVVNASEIITPETHEMWPHMKKHGFLDKIKMLFR